MVKLTDISTLGSVIDGNKSIYLPGSSGAPTEFVSSLLRNPGCARNLEILTSYVPGINSLDIDQFPPGTRITGLFMQPSLCEAQREGRYRALPVSYAGFVRHVLDRVLIDLCVIQVSPPDEQGNCSLGPAVEFMPVVLSKSRKVLALINAQTPRIPGAPTLPYHAFDYVCEVDSPLPQYITEGDQATHAIATHIAPLVRDGSVLQVGLGKVPMALSGLLCDRRNLRLHSGMLSDGLIDLQEAGALDPNFQHTACVLVGSKQLYQWATDFEQLRIAGCEVTHNPHTLLDLDRFVAVNSALEVDLFGQCNLEHANGRAISGAGGAPDFARAARLSRGGRSIVALNATYNSGKGSRIVPCLSNMAITTLPRTDIDHVVTEFGMANLCGKSVHERAEAIISVSAPAFREELSQAWSQIAARL
jgi:4-hydroxybutyrate CoA-transferase